jgi:uncharacterized protein (TIGR03089 family)
MAHDFAQTVVDAFGATMALDPAQPLLTYYDDATGERVELSGMTLANWVAKTANLLVDGLALAPGEVAAVHLPPHWQTAAVVLGCWSAGLAIDFDGTDAAAVAFATADALAGVRADDTFALALAPLGQPFRPGPPAGALDYVVEARAHGDEFRPSIHPETPALADGTTHAALMATAASRGLPRRSRVLINGDAATSVVDWLLAPLAAGASLVLCRNLDPARLASRLETERAAPYPA